MATRGHMESVVVADTFGCTTPQAIFALMKRINARFKQPVEAHFHMHFGLGVANTVAEVAAGPNVAHVTVAGPGEGAGNSPVEDVDFVMGKKSGTFTVNLGLERIGRMADEPQCLETLAKVKDLALKKKELLTQAEFVAIVNRVLGAPAEPPNHGNPILDQQVSRGGKAWLAEKKKAASTN